MNGTKKAPQGAFFNALGMKPKSGLAMARNASACSLEGHGWETGVVFAPRRSAMHQPPSHAATTRL